MSPRTRISANCCSRRGSIDAWRANFARFEAHCPDALPLAVHALEACQHRGDFARLERYLDGLRNERFRPPTKSSSSTRSSSSCTCCCSSTSSRSCCHRFAQTYDATARRVYGEPLPRPAAASPGQAAHRLSVAATCAIT